MGERNDVVTALARRRRRSRPGHTSGPPSLRVSSRSRTAIEARRSRSRLAGHRRPRRLLTQDRALVVEGEPDDRLAGTAVAVDRGDDARTRFCSVRKARTGSDRAGGVRAMDRDGSGAKRPRGPTGCYAPEAQSATTAVNSGSRARVAARDARASGAGRPWVGRASAVPGVPGRACRADSPGRTRRPMLAASSRSRRVSMPSATQSGADPPSERHECLDQRLLRVVAPRCRARSRGRS